MVTDKIKNDKKLSLIAFLGLATVVTLAFLFLAIKHTPSSVPKESIVECPIVKTNVQIFVDNSAFDKKELGLEICQLLTITNNGEFYRKIAFGKHTKHIRYPGYTEKVLKPQESVSLVLFAKGEYEIHDHFKEEIRANLRIN